MPYELHIERGENDSAAPITLQEWQAVVDNVLGVRLSNSDVVQLNPNTGQEIRLAHSAGDAEVYFRPRGIRRLLSSGRWQRVFRFNNGRASFAAPGISVNQHSDQVRLVASKLAAELSAVVVGDEGELSP